MFIRKKKKSGNTMDASTAILAFSFLPCREEKNDILFLVPKDDLNNRMLYYKAAAGDEAVFSEVMDSIILSEGYARNCVVNILGKDYLDHSCLSSGAAGLHRSPLYIRSDPHPKPSLLPLRHTQSTLFHNSGFPLENQESSEKATVQRQMEKVSSVFLLLENHVVSLLLVNRFYRILIIDISIRV